MLSPTFVPPRGSNDAKLIIIGEQPGRYECKLRKPFVGPSGKELYKCLKQAHVIEPLCYFTNCVKDLERPINYYAEPPSRGKAPKLTEAGLVWRETLKEELATLTGSTILALGNVALFMLTERWGITRWRGSILDCEFDPRFTVIPALHPATIIPPKGQYKNRWLLINDAERAWGVATGTYSPVQRSIIPEATLKETYEFFDYISENATDEKPAAYDLEVSGGASAMEKQVPCFSLGWGTNSICVPLIKHDPQYGNVDYHNPQEELEIFLRFGRFLEDSRIPKAAQNAVFDTHFMFRRYGIAALNVHDTMIAQQIIMGDYPKGLDFIASIWTDIPYYKQEGKDFFQGKHTSLQRLFHYCALDSAVVAESFAAQRQVLINQENWDTYMHQRSLVLPLAFMMERGILVDVERMESDRQESLAKINDMTIELDELTGGVNPNSSPQLIQYFYENLGRHRYKNKQGKVSCDKDALKRLARDRDKQGSDAAELILKIRKLKKLVSTYQEPDKIDPDNRMRCSYNPAGTAFSRLSSSKSIFGTGMNLQNWPHNLMGFLIPDSGYVHFSVDLSQAENRIVAWVANCHAMMKAFTNGEDVHTLTAEFIMKTFYGPAWEEHNVRDLAPLGNGEHTWRGWGKRANHGFNYDLGYRKFAIYYELQETQARLIVEGYHNKYPEIRSVFHNYVRSCLRTSRVIPNLLDRKRHFYDALEDETFKQAYSYIPQSTVGDIITQWGFEPIYYDQTGFFTPVELQNQVHDSMGFQLPLNIGWYRIAEINMAIKQNLEQPLTSPHGTQFTIPADFCMGTTLNKDDKSTAFEFKTQDLNGSIDDVAELLQTKYESLGHP